MGPVYGRTSAHPRDVETGYCGGCHGLRTPLRSPVGHLGHPTTSVALVAAVSGAGPAARANAYRVRGAGPTRVVGRALDELGRLHTCLREAGR
jgi:hypothetical protein